jgi:hypothetical protein
LGHLKRHFSRRGDQASGIMSKDIPRAKGSII